MYTESEAKNKWCPFAKSRAISGQVNQQQQQFSVTLENGHLTTCCVASNCMAWRFKRAKAGAPARTEKQDLKPDPVPGHTWYFGPNPDGEGAVWNLHEDIGYCGLAGEP